MIITPDAVSVSFRAFVDQVHAPVIMQIVPALNSGGVEQGVIDLNAAIVKAGGHSIVVSSGGVRVRDIVKAGGTHITLPVHSKNPLTIAANIARLRKIIRDNNVDIVHACSRAPAWSAGRAVQGTSAKYVTSVHAAHKINNALKRLYNSSITKGERVIAVSHFLADYLEKNYQVDPAECPRRASRRGAGEISPEFRDARQAHQNRQAMARAGRRFRHHAAGTHQPHQGAYVPDRRVAAA